VIPFSSSRQRSAKIACTTNAIESLNMSLCKAIKVSAARVSLGRYHLEVMCLTLRN
jgi:hypothetical protein